MRIVLLHDELSTNASADEMDVLVQIGAISAALAELGHESIPHACNLNLDQVAARLRALNPGLIFNLVESLNGNGRLIHLAPTLLESLCIPFTGCPATAVFATSGKLLAKQLLSGASIATPPWYTPADLQGNTGKPFHPGRYILKSVWEHASRGLDEDSLFNAANRQSLLNTLTAREPLLAGEGFAELYIDGREFNLSMLAGQVLPPAEIVFDGYAPDKPKVVGYRAKWDETSFEYTHTPRRFDFPSSDQPLLHSLTSIAEHCWRVFSLRGYARVDFRVDEAGKPWVLEINTNPCLSPDAGFAAALAQAKLTYAQAIERILNDTLAPSR